MATEHTPNNPHLLLQNFHLDYLPADLEEILDQNDLTLPDLLEFLEVDLDTLLDNHTEKEEDNIPLPSESPTPTPRSPSPAPSTADSGSSVDSPPCPFCRPHPCEANTPTPDAIALLSDPVRRARIWADLRHELRTDLAKYRGDDLVFIPGIGEYVVRAQMQDYHLRQIYGEQPPDVVSGEGGVTGPYPKPVFVVPSKGKKVLQIRHPETREVVAAVPAREEREVNRPTSPEVMEILWNMPDWDPIRPYEEVRRPVYRTFEMPILTMSEEIRRYVEAFRWVRRDEHDESRDAEGDMTRSLKRIWES